MEGKIVLISSEYGVVELNNGSTLSFKTGKLDDLKVGDKISFDLETINRVPTIIHISKLKDESNTIVGLSKYFNVSLNTIYEDLIKLAFDKPLVPYAIVDDKYILMLKRKYQSNISVQNKTNTTNLGDKRTPSESSGEIKRLAKVAKELNVGISYIVEFLSQKGIEIDKNPNTKIQPEIFRLLDEAFNKTNESVKILSTSEDNTRKLAFVAKEHKLNLTKVIELLKLNGIERDYNPYSVINEEEHQVFLNSLQEYRNTEVSEKEFRNKYTSGTIVETEITSIIKPSQVITRFENGFIGRLSILNLSWCLPTGEADFRKFKVGDRIKCVIIDIDYANKQVILGQKQLSKPISDTLTWERIERGDEFDVEIIESYNNTTLVKTKNNLYGIISNNFIEDSANRLRVKVNSKLDYSDLFSFVPASLDVEISETNEFVDPEINFIEDELLSFNNFKNSILGVYATDEQLSIIKFGFEKDDRIFSKEFKSNQTLYIQFELGSASYETTFKQNAIPYFLNTTEISLENENRLLELLSNQQNYWFKINARDNNEKIDFSLYNEEVNIFGDLTIGKNKKEVKFIIKYFSFGHSQFTSTEAKKRNAKYGSFLFSNKIKVISPYSAAPFDSSQQLFLDYALLKTQCFDIVNHLKTEAGEILRQEGRTLSIIDKFLEYQISLIDEQIEKQKDNSIFINQFDRIPSVSEGVSIKIPNVIADSFDLDEDSVVNLRIKKNDSLSKITDGRLCYNKDGNYYHIDINPNKTDFSIDSLNQGFYVDKRISKTQFLIQRQIIQDFLDKKIKIDHIEALIVKPEKVKTPILKPLEFKNVDLARTEKEDSTNNQVKAVKKAVGNQNIFLIQGPPGTGKTTVIAEIIQQLVEKGEKVLVSGQNHVAVDNVLEKLSQFPNLNLLRVGNPDRIDKQLLKYCIDNLVEDYKVDFKIFISNQLLIVEEYLRSKSIGQEKQELKKLLNQFVNTLVVKYGVLKEVYKQRHFILLDGITELTEKELKETTELLRKWIDDSNNDYEILLKPLIYNSIDVVFATCIGIKSDEVLKEKNFKFDTVIIDEAGKANIAESLVAIELGQKVILVGDQKQLPPYMDSSLIDKEDSFSFPNSIYGSEFTEDEILHALKSSFFEFIVTRINTEQFPKDNMEMLNYQHRMHPNIGQFVSKSFYEGKVKMGNRTHLNRIEMPSPFNKEVVFFDTSNSKNPFEQNDGFSAKNNTEAETISEIILPKLFENEVSPSNIAIIAPYKSQVANIKNYITRSESCKFRNIDVSTLDSFQGKEYDIIVFSFTRSSDHNNAPFENGKRKYSKVGFLDDARRLNVAFSRAKKKLILIGNSKTLTDNRSHFDKVFNYTELFRTLVKLSNNEEIGNFINVADLYDFKSPFELFCEKYKEGDNTIGTITEVGKNLNGIFGLKVNIENMSCLIPYSLLPSEIKYGLEKLTIPSQIEVKIHSIDYETKRVTLKIAEKINPFELFIKKYKKGDNVRGIITEVGKNQKGVFGLKVNIEEMSCLIPYSMLPKTVKNKLQELIIPSQIEVTIHSIDFDTKRVVLSVFEKNNEKRFPKASAWERTTAKYKKGDVVKGTIVGEVNFGFFIKIDTGLEGLLHRNSIAKGKLPKINETVQVKISKIDIEKKQIAFSY
jgi:predicted DNA helicase